MAIQNVGSLQQILNNHDAKSWTKSASLDEFEAMNSGFGKIENLEPASGQSFSEMLASSIGDVNNLQKEANVAIEKLVTGKSKNIHETMLAMEKAEIAFKSMNQIRSKVIDAYKEIMRMQV